MLAQPIHDLVADARRVLLAGCGGGYDLFGAVPLAVELWEAGREVQLASLSFCYLNSLAAAQQDDRCPNLYRVPADAATPTTYCPEAWLARWLHERLGRDQAVYGFDKTGVGPLAAAYRRIVERHDIDCLILVDGGIDSLLRGDESSLGTPAEDLASLAAVAGLQVPRLVLACVGLGSENRDGICHARVFERMAELSRQGAYLGTAALLPGTRAGARYLDAVEYTFTNQAEQRQSHVHRVVRDAMNGEAGVRGPQVWLSPLSSTYWFFDLRAVARTNLLVPHVGGTQSIWEVTAMIEGVRKSLAVRDRTTIPL